MDLVLATSSITLALLIIFVIVKMRFCLKRRGQGFFRRGRSRQDDIDGSDNITLQPLTDKKCADDGNVIAGTNSLQQQKKYLANFKTVGGGKIPYYNILLLGDVGAGKSSFYNTLATALSGQMKTAAPIGNALGNESVTRKLHPYMLFNETGEQMNIRVYDMPGIGDSTKLSDEKLKCLLKGELPDEYTFSAAEVREDQLTGKTLLQDRMHLVCLILPCMEESDEEDNSHDWLLRTVGTVRSLGIPLVGVLTKIDKIITQMDDDYSKNAEFSDAVTAACESTGVPREQMFPIVNYVNARVPKMSDESIRLAIDALVSMVKIIEDTLTQDVGKNLTTTQDIWDKRHNELVSSRPKVDKQLRLTVRNIGSARIRALCVGAAGSGKSSFIDSMRSALTGTIDFEAGVGYLQKDSCKQMQFYKMQLRNDKKKIQQKVPVEIGELPGFQSDGAQTGGDIEQLIEGKVPDDSKRDNELDDGTSRTTTVRSTEKEVNCVCFVFDILSVCTLSAAVQTTYRQLLNWVSKKKIPFIVVLTKCDELSPAVREQTLELFHNRKIKENTQKLIEIFGFKARTIFHVRSYVHERHVDPDIDLLMKDVFCEILKHGMKRRQST